MEHVESFLQDDQVVTEGAEILQLPEGYNLLEGGGIQIIDPSQTADDQAAQISQATLMSLAAGTTTATVMGDGGGTGDVTVSVNGTTAAAAGDQQAYAVMDGQQLILLTDGTLQHMQTVVTPQDNANTGGVVTTAGGQHMILTGGGAGVVGASSGGTVVNALGGAAAAGSDAGSLVVTSDQLQHLEPVSVSGVSSDVQQQIQTLIDNEGQQIQYIHVPTSIATGATTARATGVGAAGVATKTEKVVLVDGDDIQNIDPYEDQYENLSGVVLDGSNIVVEETNNGPPIKKLCIEQVDGGYVIKLTDENPAYKRRPIHTPYTTKRGVKPQPPKSQFGERTDVTQAWFTSKDDKNVLMSSGVDWKMGQWNRDEVEILQNNIALYCQERGILDPTQVIFEVSKEDRKDFYRTISQGLHRPLFAVYRRVTRMYDSKNHMGRYSPEEVQQLKELRAKYGTDWATIGNIMGRSASSVKDRCRLMREACNSGKWFAEEEERLIEAVRELTNTQPGESVTTGLSWIDVAERVATRSEKQCRAKWLNYLNWKQSGAQTWTRENDYELVEKLYELHVQDETEVDWVELATYWESTRSPQWLRTKWWQLKRRVLNYQMLNYTDILNRIRRHYIRRHRGKKQSHRHVNQRIQMILSNSNAEGVQYMEDYAENDESPETQTEQTQDNEEMSDTEQYSVLHDESSTSDLALVNQTMSGDNEYIAMSTFSDPMLAAHGSDLIAPADIKIQPDD